MRPLTRAELKDLVLLALGVLLTLHMVLTMWAQHETNRELRRMQWYINHSAALQRQVCRNTSVTPEARAECDW